MEDCSADEWLQQEILSRRLWTAGCVKHRRIDEVEHSHVVSVSAGRCGLFYEPGSSSNLL